MHSDWTLPKCDDETSLYLLFLSFCGFKLFDCPFTKFQVCCDQCKHLGARIQTHDLSQMSFLFYPLDQSLCHRRLDTKIANSNPSATHTRTSVTRLLVYVFNLGHLQQWNFAQYHTLFCQSRCKMLPKLNKPSKYCQSLFNFYQSGKISPNLVTLVTCVRRWKLTYIRKSVGLLFGFRWFA